MSSLKEPEILTAKQIAGELGITTKTLRRWQVEHGLPVIEIGKSRRYDKRHIQNWLHCRERKTSSGIGVAA